MRIFRRYSKVERRILTGAYYVGDKLKISGSPRYPYYLPFQSVVIESIRRGQALNSKTHFVFDQQHVYAPFAVKLYQHIKGHPQNLDWCLLMGDIDFKPRADAYPLQVADLLAHCWYEVLSYGKGRLEADIKKVLDAWERKNYEMQFFTKETMDRILGKSVLTKGQKFRV